MESISSADCSEFCWYFNIDSIKPGFDGGLDILTSFDRILFAFYKMKKNNKELIYANSYTKRILMNNANENPLVDFKDPINKNPFKIDNFKMNLMLD